VVSDEFAEGMYGALSRTIDENVHLTYQRDYCAGVSTSGSPPGSTDPCNVGEENEIVYIEMPVGDLGITVGVPAINNVADHLSIYPNPSTGIVTVNFSNTKQTDANITISNSIGQVVKEFNNMKLLNNKTDLDLTSLENGLYYVNIKGGEINGTLPVNLFRN
jgi:hypothetical protein